MTWARWMEASRDRILAQTPIRRRPRGRVVRVSTVFLGIDSRHLGDGVPILWETLIVGGPFDRWIARYTSALAAWRGHARSVALVEAFAVAPRPTKKALRKLGARDGATVRTTPGDVRRIRRVCARVGW